MSGCESVISLYNAEVIRRRGPWRHLQEIEFATLEWVDWFNNRRLLTSIGDVPPAEYEQRYYHAQVRGVVCATLLRRTEVRGAPAKATRGHEDGCECRKGDHLCPRWKLRKHIALGRHRGVVEAGQQEAASGGI